MRPTLETQRWTRTREDGTTETTHLTVVPGDTGNPIGEVHRDLIGELMTMGGFTKVDE